MVGDDKMNIIIAPGLVPLINSHEDLMDKNRFSCDRHESKLEIDDATSQKTSCYKNRLIRVNRDSIVSTREVH